MRSEDLLSAIGQLDDEMIAGTEKPTGSKRPPLRYYLIVAAAIVILAAVALIAGLNVNRPSDPAPVISDESSDSTSEYTVSAVPESSEEEIETDPEMTEPEVTESETDTESLSVDPYFETESESSDRSTDRMTETEKITPVVTDTSSSTGPKETAKPESSQETESEKNDPDPPVTYPEETSDPGPEIEPNVTISWNNVRSLLYDLAGSPPYYVSKGSGYGGMASFQETGTEEPLPFWLSQEYWWRDFIDSLKSSLNYDSYNESECVSRGEAAIYLYGFANQLNVTLPETREFPGFSDCYSEDYEVPAVSFVYSTGLMDPIDGERFGMNEPVNRDVFIKAARMIASYK